MNCGSPPNGVYTLAVDPSIIISFPNSHSYACVEGYEHNGSMVITCQSDGSFDRLPPSCSRTYLIVYNDLSGVTVIAITSYLPLADVIPTTMTSQLLYIAVCILISTRLHIASRSKLQRCDEK